MASGSTRPEHRPDPSRPVQCPGVHPDPDGRRPPEASADVMGGMRRRTSSCGRRRRSRATRSAWDEDRHQARPRPSSRAGGRRPAAAGRGSNDDRRRPGAGTGNVIRPPRRRHSSRTAPCSNFSVRGQLLDRPGGRRHVEDRGPAPASRIGAGDNRRAGQQRRGRRRRHGHRRRRDERAADAAAIGARVEGGTISSNARR